MFYPISPIFSHFDSAGGGTESDAAFISEWGYSIHLRLVAIENFWRCVTTNEF